MAASERKPAFALYCHGCGELASPDSPFTCANCGEPMSLRAQCSPHPGHFTRPGRTMWHHFPLLPIRSRQDVVTLGEGATPLISAHRLADRFGISELQLKLESANPTGSFKDRQVSVGISRAVELRARTVTAVSSGNVAASTAAYAARAGIRAVLFMHAHASMAKIAQAHACGAEVIRVDSPSPKAVFSLCAEACRRWGWQQLSTAGLYDPYNVEGAKTIAYELYQQFRGNLPDWVVMPVGGGGLLGGVWRGFLDLQRLGLIKRPPRLAGVQAAGCAPLKAAIDAGTPFLETLRHPWPDPKTIAGGIADDILFDGHTALPAIRTTNGAALAVTDPEIEAALSLLAQAEGILCELTSAVVIAGLEQLPDRTPQTRVCCIITGNGIKDLGYLAARAPEPPLVPPKIDAIAAVCAPGAA